VGETRSGTGPDVLPTVIAVRPQPDPEVLAVLAAAVELAWPRPPVVAEPEPAGPPAWRFSGRWWSRPPASRRMRPSS
jgi:hypothetical protein